MPIEVKIASPCVEKWSDEGDERVRFCARCQLNVFNVKELSEPEVRALLARGGGQVCGRVFRRRDGTVFTRDCPTGLARVRRQARLGVGLAAIAVVALLGFGLRSAPACPREEDASAGWLRTLLEARFIAAREALRGTQTFGPLIDELSPRQLTMGRMVTIQQIRGE